MFEMRAKMITVGLLGAAAMLPIDHAKTDQLGHASWYSLPTNITADGEQMDPNELTAAHRSLPFGMRVLVENLSNGRSVVVRINDRGPFIGGRIIDLSKAAAESIGMIDSGVAKVRVTTPDGSMLAALHESESNFTSGELLATVDKIEITAMDDAKVPTAAQPIPAKPESVKSSTLSPPSVAGAKTASKLETAAQPIPAKPESVKSSTLSPPSVAGAKTASKLKHAESGASPGKAAATKSSTKTSVTTKVKSSVKTIGERSVKTAANTASNRSEKTVFKSLVKIATRAIAPMFASARPSGATHAVR
jgi:rare lipoprotein A